MKKVIIIVGPTASGKTKYSIKLAKALNLEVINGDSVQIYKELNIGSAKIKDEEMEEVAHHLFSIKNVGEEYSSFNFQKDARELLKQIKRPLIVGGTGYYIKSALYDYDFNKNVLSSDFSDLTNLEIYEKLVLIDQNIKIDINNRIRLINAYNEALSGNLRSEKTSGNKPLYDILPIYLDLDRKILKDLLIKRLDLMIEAGLILETNDLLKQGHELNIIGYREIAKYLKGEYSLDDAKEKIISASMKLAKKQKTWFKNQMNPIFVDPLDLECEKKIINLAKDFLGE